MKPQTTIQILRCLTLGGYTARVVDGRLETEGPQPLAGPLPASIETHSDQLVTFLGERCGGVWPPAPGSRVWAERQPHKATREERAREFHRRLQKLREKREEAA